MTIRQRVSLVALFTIAASMVRGVTLRAQICHGTPRGGGVAYEPGKVTYGSTQGGGVTFTPGGVAFGLGFRSISADTGISGFEGTFRFDVVIGSKLQICPGIGLGFEQIKSNPAAPSTLTTDRLTGRAGIGAGYDFAVYKGFGLAPFVVVEYAEHVTYFDLKVPNYHSTNTGNTGGQAEAEYGIIAHYSHFYAGRAATHRFAAGKPLSTRWILGFAF